MRREILRLCTFVRVRSLSRKNAVPAENHEAIVASIGQLDERLAKDIGMMLHKRQSGAVLLDDVMEFVDLWLDKVGDAR